MYTSLLFSPHPSRSQVQMKINATVPPQFKIPSPNFGGRMSPCYYIFIPIPNVKAWSHTPAVVRGNTIMFSGNKQTQLAASCSMLA
jgi:hypothetical protein